MNERLLDEAIRALREIGRFAEADAVSAVLGLAPAGAGSGRGPDDPIIDAAATPVCGSLGDGPVQYTEAARVARDAGRFDDALRLLAEADDQFPDHDEVIAASGWLAHVMRDWPLASFHWKNLRERAPWHVVGYVNGAVAAREMGEPRVAEKLLGEAVERFPDQAEPLIEWASLAQHAGRADDAAERWRLVRERFPDVPAAYVAIAAALRAQERFADADAVLSDTATRFSGDATVATERCWTAHIAHDWLEAAGRWAALRERFPELSVGYTSGAVALRETGDHDAAQALLDDAMRRFPNEPAPVLEHAWLATALRRWPEAFARWEAARSRFPDRVETWLRSAAAAAEQWDYATAENLLEAAMDRFPDEAAVFIDYAAIAYAQHRLDAARQRFIAVQGSFPKRPEGYLGIARVLRNQFRLPEAEAALEEGQSAVPDAVEILLERARLPLFPPLLDDRNPGLALSRFAAIADRFPKDRTCWVERIRLLRELRRYDDAARVTEQGMAAHPEAAELAVEYAAIAAAKGHADVALRRYREAAARFPADVNLAIGLAHALAAAGQDTAADAAARDALARFPGVPASAIAFAEMAMRREDWTEALARWTAGQQRFPDDNRFAQRAFDVRLLLAGSDAETAAEAKPVPGPDDDPKAALREMVMRFESLGGRGIGCEFGMFQREFGAEPLGLLRWADMPFEGIVAVLESRFAGVGDPANTEVFVDFEHGRPEYCTRDTRGFMFMRAFVYQDEMPMDRMRKQALRRLGFLRDKLIGDLETGAKVLVWRCTERNLSDAELNRLHAAVRAYGDNVLLYVRYEDTNHPNGLVEWTAPGLMVGYIDRFKMSPDGTLSSNPASASWLQICRAALGLFENKRHPTAE